MGILEADVAHQETFKADANKLLRKSARRLRIDLS
jgi:hypothetical protein